MAKIKEALDVLNVIDEYGNSLQHRLNEVNQQQQDILHYIESNKISMLWCYNIVMKIKNIRVERRKIKNDMELIYKYNELKNRLSSKDSRQFILSELHKKEKNLQTVYKNRQYTEEDIRDILKGIVKDDKNK